MKISGYMVLLHKVFSKAIANPQSAIAALTDPEKALGFIELQRNSLSVSSFFEFAVMQNREMLSGYLAELLDSDFYKTLRNNMEKFRIDRQDSGALLTSGYLDHFGELNSGYLLYTIVRALKPRVVLETGVANGESTAIILYALDRNETAGELWSIDLPYLPNKIFADKLTYYLPEGAEIGWLVPSQLRNRWHLHLGDAREVLPQLLPKLGEIDLFLHDSLHTFEHMLFEFNSVWPYLRKRGLLLSDDISAKLFRRFLRLMAAKGKVCGSLTAFLKMD